MNSATKVGEIFTKAGESFHKMADMTMMLDAKAQDLNVTSVKKQVRFSPVVFFSIFHWSKYMFGRISKSLHIQFVFKIKSFSTNFENGILV